MLPMLCQMSVALTIFLSMRVGVGGSCVLPEPAPASTNGNDDDDDAAGADHRDPLVRWLEEVMTEHGKVDENFLSEVSGVAAPVEIDTEPAEAKLDLTKDWAAFRANHDLEDIDFSAKKVYIRSNSGILFGFIDKMSGEENWKATCGNGAHQKCGCWIKAKKPFKDSRIFISLCEWLFLSSDTDAADHADWSKEARRMYALLPAWACTQVINCQVVSTYVEGTLQTTCLVRISHQHSGAGHARLPHTPAP